MYYWIIIPIIIILLPFTYLSDWDLILYILIHTPILMPVDGDFSLSGIHQLFSELDIEVPVTDENNQEPVYSGENDEDYDCDIESSGEEHHNDEDAFAEDCDNTAQDTNEEAKGSVDPSVHTSDDKGKAKESVFDRPDYEWGYASTDDSKPDGDYELSKNPKVYTKDKYKHLNKIKVREWTNDQVADHFQDYYDMTDSTPGSDMDLSEDNTDTKDHNDYSDKK